MRDLSNLKVDMKEEHSIVKGRLFLIFTGLMFFFNPCFNLFDFLPDFIGYMILCSLLVPLGDISDTMGEAISAFKRMAYARRNL